MSTTSQYKKSLVWFRRDLRSTDNAALFHALKNSREVYCVFIYDTTILDELGTHDRRVDFIHGSIGELDSSLRSMGGTLIVREGNPTLEIPLLALELGVDAVYFNHDYEPDAVRRDSDVKSALETSDCDCHTFKDHVIFEKSEVTTLQGKPFSVFTPYKRAWLKALAEPQNDFFYREYPVHLYSEHLAMPPEDVLEPLPSLADMGFEKTNILDVGIKPGMTGGAEALTLFRSKMGNYHEARNIPAIAGTSWLSVHLRFGTVSPRKLVATALELYKKFDTKLGAEAWLNELIWRDFYIMILFTCPYIVTSAFKPSYDRIVWEEGPESDVLFNAWREGRTGYPLVDAAMRQLAVTGYMHNRLRMVVASFLTKDLGIHWQRGEAYFAEALNDYDLAANNGGWQWAASSGADAAPYFRIFSPVRQSERFDPEGVFIKKYLPQLEKLTKKEIHAPWLVEETKLLKAGIVMGRDYPLPIVDHDQARKETLARYEVVKVGMNEADW